MSWNRCGTCAADEDERARAGRSRPRRRPDHDRPAIDDVVQLVLGVRRLRSVAPASSTYSPADRSGTRQELVVQPARPRPAPPRASSSSQASIDASSVASVAAPARPDSGRPRLGCAAMTTRSARSCACSSPRRWCSSPRAGPAASPTTSASRRPPTAVAGLDDDRPAGDRQPRPPRRRPAPMPAGEPPTGLTLEPVVDGLDSPVDIADPARRRRHDARRRAGRAAPGRPRRRARRDAVPRHPRVGHGRRRAGPARARRPSRTRPTAACSSTTPTRDGRPGRRLVPDRIRTTRTSPCADSERRLLVMDDRFGNHNGGGLASGRTATCTSRPATAAAAATRSTRVATSDTLLAKILRIDVDVAADTEPPYGDPGRQPVRRRREGARGEIWLTGLRNPWRIRFDQATGDLWIGDVGQGACEEIDVRPAGVGGLDFGWNVMEGPRCFRDRPPATPTGLTLPVAEYGHDEGCSVTGGTVYRGTAHPASPAGTSSPTTARDGSGRSTPTRPTGAEPVEPSRASTRTARSAPSPRTGRRAVRDRPRRPASCCGSVAAD